MNRRAFRFVFWLLAACACAHTAAPVALAQGGTTVYVWPRPGTTVLVPDAFGHALSAAGEIVFHSTYIDGLVASGYLLTAPPDPSSLPSLTYNAAAVLVPSLQTTPGAFGGQSVFAQGYYAIADGAGGWFAWDETSTASADSGTILGNATAGRWVRVFSGPINVRWFGAAGDGATDDRAAIKLAIAAAAKSGGLSEVYFPPSATPYMISRHLAIPSYVTILGGGKQSIIKLMPNSNDSMLINDTPTGSGNSYVGVKNISLDGDASNQANNITNAAFGFAVGFVNCQHCFTENIWVKDPSYDCIYWGKNGGFRILNETGTGSVNYSVGGPSTHGHTDHLYCERPWRNGISATYTQEVTLDHVTIVQANWGTQAGSGTASPSTFDAAAIDIEPNQPGDYCFDLSVTNSIILSPYSNGIALQGSGHATRNVTIANNIVRFDPYVLNTSSGSGLNVGSAITNVTVIGNRVENGGNGGRYANASNNVAFVGNVFARTDGLNFGNGMLINNGGSLASITGNTMVGYTTGFSISAATGDIDDLVLSSNVIQTFDGTNQIVIAGTGNTTGMVAGLNSGYGTTGDIDNGIANNAAYMQSLILGNVTPANNLTFHATGTSTAVNPPSVAAGANLSAAPYTVTVTGALVGDEVQCSFSLANTGLVWHGDVTSADTATCWSENLSAGAIDQASGTVRASVWRH